METDFCKSKKEIRIEKRKKLNLPNYTTLEEIFSAITHGIGAALAIAAIVLLIVFSPFDAKTITCVTIYSATLFVLYIVSTLYHALGINKAKKVYTYLSFDDKRCNWMDLIFFCLGQCRNWNSF